MKEFEDISVADLVTYATKRGLGLDAAVDEILREQARNLDFEIPTHLIAMAIDLPLGKIEIFKETQRLNRLMLSLVRAVPADVDTEIRKKLGQEGLEVFRAALQKLFLDVVGSDKFALDIKRAMRELNESLAKNIAFVAQKESFDPFEGANPIPEMSDDIKVVTIPEDARVKYVTNIPDKFVGDE